MIIAPVSHVCKLSSKEDTVEVKRLVKARVTTDPKNDDSRARTPTPCGPAGWGLQRCQQALGEKEGSAHDHSCVGVPPRPLYDGVGSGGGCWRDFCAHSSVPGALQSSAAPESFPGWTVSKET